MKEFYCCNAMFYLCTNISFGVLHMGLFDPANIKKPAVIQNILCWRGKLGRQDYARPAFKVLFTDLSIIYSVSNDSSFELRRQLIHVLLSPLSIGHQVDRYSVPHFVFWIHLHDYFRS